MDPLNEILPTDESIVAVMSLEEVPWNGLHHRSHFLPCLDEIPSCPEVSVSHPFTPPFQIHIWAHEILSEGSMGNMTATLSIDILVYLKIVKIFQLGAPFPCHEIKIFMPPFMRFFH